MKVMLVKTEIDEKGEDPGMSVEDRVVGSANNFVICTLERFFYRWADHQGNTFMVLNIGKKGTSLAWQNCCCAHLEHLQQPGDVHFLPRNKIYPMHERIFFADSCAICEIE